LNTGKNIFEEKIEKIDFKLNLKHDNLTKSSIEPKVSARTNSCTERMVKKDDLHRFNANNSDNNKIDINRILLNKKASASSLFSSKDKLEHNISNHSLYRPAHVNRSVEINDLLMGNSKTYRRNNNSSVGKNLINNNSTDNLTKNSIVSKSYNRNSSCSETANSLTRNTSKSTLSKNISNYNSQIKSSSNIVVNQNGGNCFNNINIYTTAISSGSGNFKTNDIRLKQFIINKSIKPKNIRRTNYSQII